tara:strand:- start:323 stop:829 length:507 start_codon:yes stop_codon:yes gene_type:complete
MKRQDWTSHVFNHGIDPGWAANIMTRVQDTGIRLSHYCINLSNEQLSHKSGTDWSIKEHIGHLTDLEVLHHDRLRQFAVLQLELSAADMSNAKTEKAEHNQKNISTLLSEFIEVRDTFIKDFRALSNESLNHKAMHPRLKVPMRPVDLLFFVAEHDDHHLATITKLST